MRWPGARGCGSWPARCTPTPTLSEVVEVAYKQAAASLATAVGA